jgi:hypothetical protein
MIAMSINRKLGLLKPVIFKEWFCKRFPQLKDEWQSYYKEIGGVIRKGEEVKK